MLHCDVPARQYLTIFCKRKRSIDTADNFDLHSVLYCHSDFVSIFCLLFKVTDCIYEAKNARVRSQIGYSIRTETE